MRVLMLIGLLLLAGCTRQAALDRIASREQQRLAITVADELRAGDVDALRQRTDTGFRGSLTDYVARVQPTLSRVRGAFAVESAFSSRRISRPGGTVTTVIVKGGTGDAWAVVSIVLRSTSRGTSLVGLDARPFDRDPATRYAFDIRALGLPGYLFLALMTSSAAACIWATVLIWRRRWLGRRWLWTLGSLFGVAGLGVNWATGDWYLSLFKLSLLGAHAQRAGNFGPYFLSVSFPIVAIIVIHRWYAGPGRPADAPL